MTSGRTVKPCPSDGAVTATRAHSDPRATKTIYGHLFPESAPSIAVKPTAYLDGTTA